MLDINGPDQLIDLLKTKNCHISSKDLVENADWFGATSPSEAVKNITKKRSPIKTKLLNIPETRVGYETVTEIVGYEERRDIVGYYPDVPAYLQGHPLNMINTHPVKKQGLRKNVRIWCNLAIDSMFEPITYEKRGVAAYNLLRHYLDQSDDVDVSFIILDATFVEGETVIQRMILDKETCRENIHLIYNLLTDICAYRVAFLNSKIAYLKEKGLSGSWDEGHGYCMNSIDVGRTLGIDPNDIYFGVPDDEFPTPRIDLRISEIDFDELGGLSAGSD